MGGTQLYRVPKGLMLAVVLQLVENRPGSKYTGSFLVDGYGKVLLVHREMWIHTQSCKQDVIAQSTQKVWGSKIRECSEQNIWK